jgi:hypothetical protein
MKCAQLVLASGRHICMCDELLENVLNLSSVADTQVCISKAYSLHHFYLLCNECVFASSSNQGRGVS